jgi:hypothetical protein
MLPWYTDKERDLFSDYQNNVTSNIHEIPFSELLKLFLEEGRKIYGKVWESDIWYTGMSYKLRQIWDFDQVLMAEMTLASKPSLRINSDLRRLDKFLTSDRETDYRSAVQGKYTEDFTDAHLDSVEDNNWWRLEAIWQLIFINSSFLSESHEFIEAVRSFYDAIRGTDDEYTRGLLFFQDVSELQNALGFCDKV